MKPKSEFEPMRDVPMGPPPPPFEEASDRRLKTEIRVIGETILGLPLYSFRYASGGGVQVGVMAQDVEQVMPEAVTLIDGGYLAVDYAKLGLASLARCNRDARSDPAPMGPPPPPNNGMNVDSAVDVVRIGTSLHGAPIYSYRFKDSGVAQLGLLASEVAGVSPEAVWTREDGALKVNYRTLDLIEITHLNAACRRAAGIE